jgi:hypothetical protein
MLKSVFERPQADNLRQQLAPRRRPPGGIVDLLITTVIFALALLAS